jgi:uncharacterized membrane protein
LERRPFRFGWRIYGLGIVVVGLVGFAFGDFHPGQPVPKSFPARTTLAFVANGFLIIAGVLMQLRRFTAPAAAALTGYFAIVVVLVMDGNVLIHHPELFGGYEGTAIELAIAAAGLVICASSFDIERQLAMRLTSVGQVLFGACALVFGAAHFVYLKYTTALVPQWLPPSQTFWAILCGIAHIAAGIAILTGVYARVAAILLTLMFASFTPLVHVPLLVSDPHKYFYWTENAINILLTGAAWVIADSLSARRNLRIHRLPRN